MHTIFCSRARKLPSPALSAVHACLPPVATLPRLLAEHARARVVGAGMPAAGKVHLLCFAGYGGAADA
eukprot:4784019-Pleurochrysis_carterae.AAC.4